MMTDTFIVLLFAPFFSHFASFHFSYIQSFSYGVAHDHFFSTVFVIVIIDIIKNGTEWEGLNQYKTGNPSEKSSLQGRPQDFSPGKGGEII